MKRATLSQSLSFDLPSYTALSGKSIDMYPASPGDGIVFADLKKGKEISVNSESLRGVQDISGARFNILKDENGRTVFKVVEHVISAVVAAGIQDVRVVCKKGFVPVIGPGIMPLYDPLKENRVETDVDLPNFTVEERSVFNDTDSDASLIVKPLDTLGVSGRKKHADLSDMRETPFQVDDLYSSIEEGKCARPVARLQNKYVYKLWRALHNKNLVQGIHPDAYIIARPGMSGDDIVGSMKSHYQEGRNEHYVHSAYADIPGELHAFFPGQIKGGFEFINGNHVSRVKLLRQAAKSGVVLED